MSELTSSAREAGRSTELTELFINGVSTANQRERSDRYKAE